MVQTYQSPVRVYKHPFELVMAAYHKRFPTCPQIPIFVGSEITSEWHSEDGAEEIIERKCQLNVDAPYLVKKIAGVEFIYFKQRNHLNMRQRTLLIEASNISFSSRIVVVENCKYYVHTDNAEWTCFEQSASLDVKSFFGFEAAVEKLAVKQYGANIAKGKEVLEFFIEDLIKSGITHIPAWNGATDESNTITKVDDLHHALGTDSAIDVSSTDGAESGCGKSSTAVSEVHHDGTAIKTAMERRPSTPLARTPSSAVAAAPASSSSTAAIATIKTGASTLANVAAGCAATDLVVANAPPLSGTAEEKLSVEELKRRRSSGAGGTKQTAVIALMSGGGGGAAVADGVPPGAAKMVADRTRSFDDIESKLESEYIQRFLGQLTPLEESRLCELKYGLQNMHKGKMPNDAHLLRFLRARDFDVHKATQMVLNSLLWRKQHKIDSLLDDFVPPSVLQQYFPGGWHHNDIEGRPLFILRLGQMDIKGILRSVGLASIVKFTLSICEQGLIKSAEATHRLGKPISTWTLLVDLEGLSMRHLWRPGVQCLLRIIEIVEAHYPETMGLVLITRAPRVFPVLWTLVLPFIDENTRKKFELYASEDVLKELGRYIPKQFLPNFLGGPAHCEQSVTTEQPPWMVPKSEYLSTPSDELMRESGLTNTYTNVTVNKGTPYEIYVWISQAGSVLTWDFDITKAECEFIIYRSEKKIAAAHQQKKQSATSSTNAQGGGATAGGGASGGAGGGGAVSSSVAATVLGPVERVVDEISNLLSAGGGGGSSNTTPHFQAITGEPGFRVGVELSIAEGPLSFGEGDSMQGSHYCAKPGTYILQWRHPSDSPPAAALATGGVTVAPASVAGTSTALPAVAVCATPSLAATTEASAAASADGGTEAALVATPPTASSNEKPQLHQHHRSGGVSATTGSTSSGTATHKCRLMVYHEVLNSADFKGSVASLQSCRSSFNSLAVGESSLHSLSSTANPSPNTKLRSGGVDAVLPTKLTANRDQTADGKDEEQDDDTTTTTDQTPKAH